MGSDNDNDSCETYKKNINPDRVIHDDIREFNKKLKKKKSIKKLMLSVRFPAMILVTWEKKWLMGKYGPLYKEALKLLIL